MWEGLPRAFPACMYVHSRGRSSFVLDGITHSFHITHKCITCVLTWLRSPSSSCTCNEMQHWIIYMPYRRLVMLLRTTVGLFFWGIFLNINSLHFLFWQQCGKDRKMLKSDPWECVNNKERRPKLLSISIKKGIKLVNQWIQGKAPKITVGNIWFPDKCAAFKSFF